MMEYNFNHEKYNHNTFFKPTFDKVTVQHRHGNIILEYPYSLHTKVQEFFDEPEVDLSTEPIVEEEIDDIVDMVSASPYLYSEFFDIISQEQEHR